MSQITGRKADRHAPGRQVSVSARLDRDDYDRLESRRKTAGLSRRQAIIAAIRDWVSRTENSDYPKQEGSK